MRESDAARESALASQREYFEDRYNVLQREL
jgi:hypothetical protein